MTDVVTFGVDDVVRALERFEFVEPITIDDMFAIADHLRGEFPGARVDIHQNRARDPLTIRVCRIDQVVLTHKIEI